MKYTYMILILLGIALFSCKDDIIETTQIETVEFVPDADPNDILDDFPDGVISFSINNQATTNTITATASVTPKETLIVGEFEDPNSGSLKFFIIGAKGFCDGTFKGNIINSQSLSNFSLNRDQADITITQFGDIGELVSGNFSLEYIQNGEEVSLQGDFSALRIL